MVVSSPKTHVYVKRIGLTDISRQLSANIILGYVRIGLISVKLDMWVAEG